MFVVLLVALIAMGALPLSPVSAQTDPPKSPPIEPVDPCKPVSSSTSGGDRYIVSAEAVNLRSGPSIDCGIVAELERETELTLVGEFVVDDEFTWAPVETASGAGYVVLQNIQLVPDSATCDRSVKIEGAKENGFTSGSVNLRTGPGLGCAVITTLNAGTPVEVHGNAIQRDGEAWLSVSTPLGNGYLVQDGYAPPGSWDQPEAVAVLMYHDIGDNNNRYVVAPWQLEQQLIWLRDNGYTSITPRELAAHLDTGAPLPPRPVILSVDDGWASARIFRDLLTAYGFRGTYMLPSYAELTPEEIYDLNQSGEVCGHSVSHPFLDQMSWEAQWYEIAENKAWLDSITGTSTTCFAYPFGAFNEATTQIVIDAGYSLAFHAWDGVQYFDYLDRWHITRIEVSGEWDLGLFASVVSF
ncbi:MAG: polysaccharide deacetylase family protein [Thermomicrobiales bacterium]